LSEAKPGQSGDRKKAEKRDKCGISSFLPTQQTSAWKPKPIKEFDSTNASVLPMSVSGISEDYSRRLCAVVVIL
jgi:hypothetical protein